MGPQNGSAALRGGVFGWIAAPALSALLFMSIFFVPLLGGLLNPFAPLPIVYHFFTHGQNATAVAVLAVASFITAVAGIKTGGFYLFSYGAAGFIMALMMRSGAGLSRAVGAPSIAAFLFTGIFFFLASGKPPAELYASALEQLRALVGESITLYEKAGMPADQLNILKENAEPITLWALRIFPATAAVLYLGMFFTNYLTYAALRKRWTFLPAVDGIDLSRWSAPERTVFMFIAGGALLLVPGDLADTAGVNLLIVACSLYFITGLCIIRFWFEKARFPKFLRWTVYVLVLLQPFMMAGLAGLGLFDLWFDFRKIRRREGGKEENNGTDT